MVLTPRAAAATDQHEQPKRRVESGPSGPVTQNRE